MKWLVKWEQLVQPCLDTGFNALELLPLVCGAGHVFLMQKL